MMNTKIITSAREWNALVHEAHFYDVYHFHSYGLLDNTGRSVLFVVYDAMRNFIALPILIRPIPGYDYYDCTSVYGYPGPISNLPYERLSISFRAYFKLKLHEFFKDANIITAFSRMNPLEPSMRNFFKDFGDVTVHNKTVAIDLRLTEQQNWMNYRDTNRQAVKKLKASGFSIKVADTEEEVKEFIGIYHETMNRVHAAKHYYFDETYFHNLLYAPDLHARILLAYHDGCITSGAIITDAKDVMQYHLSGTKNEFLKYAPGKLILDEARCIAREEKLKYLHLGGGTSSDENDQLLRFKAGFSNLFFEFSTWRMIVDQQAYNEVVNDVCDPSVAHETFFPLYRKYIPAEPVVNIAPAAPVADSLILND